MKNDLSNLKAGDKVWHSVDGELMVKSIDNILAHPIGIGYSTYTTTGRKFLDDKHPTIFRSLDAMIEYWIEYRDSLKRISGKEAFRIFKEGGEVRKESWDNTEFYLDKHTTNTSCLKQLIADSNSNELNWEKR